MSADVGFNQQIKKIVGDAGVLDAAPDMQPYLTSWRNGWTGKAQLVVLPATTAQLAALVGLCHKNHVTIVPQGGNTGLVGGGIPTSVGDQIIINLSRMNKIRALDPVGLSVTVEAGVILQKLQEKAAEAGFLFPLSMASEGSAEIGGAISTNAGGTAVLRYGNMRDLVRGVEVVLPDGQIFSSLGKLPKDNTGYDLGTYFIGAEGTLGIITAATLKLFPPLNQKLTAILALPDAASSLELLKNFRRDAAEYLTAFEIMSHAALTLVVKHMKGARFPGKNDAPYYVLVELGASSHATPLWDILEKLAARALEDKKILDAVVAENTGQAQEFWRLRENISESLRQEGQGIHFDISLPLDQIADFLKTTEPKIKAVATDVIVAPFGHIGDGNLHYNMCFAAAPAQFAALKKRIQDIVYSEVKTRRGSISAEHGIGVERKVELLNYKSPAEIELMKSIKRALDPTCLMNPGKIFDL